VARWRHETSRRNTVWTVKPPGIEIVPVDGEGGFWEDRRGLLTCLRETPPRVPAYLGYDALGSELFEAITELPGYYLTRVEHGLLQRHAEHIADLIGYERIAEQRKREEDPPAVGGLFTTPSDLLSTDRCQPRDAGGQRA
jgi:Histidine-specific methyltransferase, SAM-dependent